MSRDNYLLTGKTKKAILAKIAEFMHDYDYYFPRKEGEIEKDPLAGGFKILVSRERKL